MPDERYAFPSSEFGKRNLKFQYSWLKAREWLVYSKKLDGAFCKYCVGFAPSGAGKQGLPLGRLVRAEYSDWRHAQEDFRKHELTAYHANSKLDAENFFSVFNRQKLDIVSQLDKSLKNQVEENRRLLSPVIKTVIFCGRQGLALRGHRDGGIIDDLEGDQIFTENEGNFRALLRLRVESGDEILKQHLLTAKRNATYTSWRIQNEIISACNDIILHKLVEKVNEAKCFSVIADETADISNVEQLSLCVKYIDLDHNSVREDFLQFVPIYDMTGKGIANAILSKLKAFGIDTQYIRGQGFDGASAMSGIHKGVQHYIKEEIPNAHYVHCSSHSLNLAISDACDCPMVRNCLGTVNKVYDFFNTPKRQAVLNKFSENPLKKLKQPSPTRWIQRHNAVDNFAQKYDEVLKSLKEISAWTDKDTSANAHILLCAVNKFELVLSLGVINKLFSYSLPLTKYLESESIDLAGAVNYAQDTLDQIKEIRNKADEEFSPLYKKVVETCDQNDIVISIPRLSTRQTGRDNMPNDGPESYYKRTLFIPFIDHFITQLNERFISHKNILSSFQVLLNTNNEDVPEAHVAVNVLFNEYCSDLTVNSSQQLLGEIKIWQRRIEQIDLERRESCKLNKKRYRQINAVEALQVCNISMYPSVNKLLQILATLPVTSCTAERSFSTLKYLKSYLRNTTSETRLNGLALLYVHKDILVNSEEVLNELAKKPRRLDIKI